MSADSTQAPRQRKLTAHATVQMSQVHKRLRSWSWTPRDEHVAKGEEERGRREGGMLVM